MPGISAVSPPIQRAAGLLAAVRDAFDDRFDLSGMTLSQAR